MVVKCLFFRVGREEGEMFKELNSIICIKHGASTRQKLHVFFFLILILCVWIYLLHCSRPTLKVNFSAAIRFNSIFLFIFVFYDFFFHGLVFRFYFFFWASRLREKYLSVLFDFFLFCDCLCVFV